MELTYTVKGADGKEYGPVNLEQISAWTRDGRVQAQSEIQRSDMEHWAPAGEFTEFKSAFQPSIPQIPTTVSRPVASEADPATLRQIKSGASWFYWIAGLSLVNSVVAFTGSDWRFLLGLGITQILDLVGPQFGGAGKAIVLVLDLMVAGAFIFFGIFANKRQLWAFIIGMAFFALDSIVFVLGQDWLGVGFHAFALFWMFRGFSACREVNG